MRIIDTDNFGGDYPDEKFLEPLPFLSAGAALRIANLLNELTGGPDAPRYYRVVENDYVLQPGFEP